jgi:DNA-binding response OmpR family regulator
MFDEQRARRWNEVWEQRRRRFLDDDVAELWLSLAPPARAILDEARRLAANDDPDVHATADVAGLIERVNALEGSAPLLLHRPVCNALSLLRIAAEELLAARASTRVRVSQTGVVRTWSPDGRGRRAGFDWFLVVGDSAELLELVVESSRALAGSRPIHSALTLEAALERLARRDGTGLVISNLSLDSASGAGPHGLQVAADARRRRHAALLVTAASDYLEYWSRLPEAGLTGHDVIVKTRRDFAERLRGRVREIAQPEPMTVSYEEDTGHVVWIGDVEVTQLEAQEALVLRVLDETWQTPEAISDACSDTDLAPSPGGVPSLISTVRRKLTDALVSADSPRAAGEVIQSRRRDGLPAQYRLAPGLRWDDPQVPAGAAHALPPVLVIEDDPGWALWVTTCLEELDWPATVARTAEEARQALEEGDPSILVVDLALPGSGTGQPDFEVGLRLIEDLAGRRHGVRVVVLSALNVGDTLRARLFEAGVRTVDVVRKGSDRDDCRALLLASLQRAADELWRGVRRAREPLGVHRVVRLERARIEVDGHPIQRLSPREAAVVDLLIGRPNTPMKAELLEDQCFPTNGYRRPSADGKPLNKVHQTFKRLRHKIDRDVDRDGVGALVIRTPHRGARTTYELHGLVTDLVDRDEPSR